MLTSLISMMAQTADAASAAGDAAADVATKQQGGFEQYSGLIMIVVLIAVFYFLLIRPQQKRQKEIRKMRESLREGDQVVTAGGIYGKVVSIKDNVVLISISDGVKIKVDKGSVYASAADMQQQATR